MKDGMTDKASSFRPLANTGSAVIPIDTDWISPTNTLGDNVSILTIVSKSSFSETLTSTAIQFAAGTDVSSLTGFFSEVLFSVKANTLSAPSSDSLRRKNRLNGTN
ncbi:hypothetical protein BLNAU_14564 [Blattamonas nauphoetae]|uniref:Uncharacterized protein n=1 Tax=Blattamonas nauphoetae TaxID=2049346 RepID=A0ABQ9XEQ6_9EUKA|nr:hypothetical protein BLNAU_14564 [Blattamonas nauphoetae]